MAQPFTPQPLPSVDWGTTAEAPPQERSDLGISWDVGWEQMRGVPAWFQGAGASLFEAAGLPDLAAEYRIKASDTARDMAFNIQELESLYTGPHTWKEAQEGVGAFALWGINEAVKQVPNLALMALTAIGTGGAGAVLAGSGRLAITRLAAANLARQKAIAGGARKYTIPQLTATAGVGLSSALLNTGEIYSSALLSTGENNPGVTGLAGILAGAFDMWPGSKVVRAMGRTDDYGSWVANQFLRDSKWRRRLYRGLELSATEGLVEDIQTVIEGMTVNYLQDFDLEDEFVNYAYGLFPMTGEQQEERIEARAAGALLGGFLSFLGRTSPPKYAPYENKTTEDAAKLIGTDVEGTLEIPYGATVDIPPGATREFPEEETPFAVPFEMPEEATRPIRETTVAEAPEDIPYSLEEKKVSILGRTFTRGRPTPTDEEQKAFEAIGFAERIQDKFATKSKAIGNKIKKVREKVLKGTLFAEASADWEMNVLMPALQRGDLVLPTPEGGLYGVEEKEQDKAYINEIETAFKDDLPFPEPQTESEWAIVKQVLGLSRPTEAQLEWNEYRKVVEATEFETMEGYAEQEVARQEQVRADEASVEREGRLENLSTRIVEVLQERGQSAFENLKDKGVITYRELKAITDELGLQEEFRGKLSKVARIEKLETLIGERVDAKLVEGVKQTEAKTAEAKREADRKEELSDKTKTDSYNKMRFMYDRLGPKRFEELHGKLHRQMFDLISEYEELSGKSDKTQYVRAFLTKKDITIEELTALMESLTGKDKVVSEIETILVTKEQKEVAVKETATGEVDSLTSYAEFADTVQLWKLFADNFRLSDFSEPWDAVGGFLRKLYTTHDEKTGKGTLDQKGFEEAQRYYELEYYKSKKTFPVPSWLGEFKWGFQDREQAELTLQELNNAIIKRREAKRKKAIENNKKEGAKYDPNEGLSNEVVDQKGNKKPIEIVSINLAGTYVVRESPDDILTWVISEETDAFSQLIFRGGPFNITDLPLPPEELVEKVNNMSDKERKEIRVKIRKAKRERGRGAEGFALPDRLVAYDASDQIIGEQFADDARSIRIRLMLNRLVAHYGTREQVPLEKLAILAQMEGIKTKYLISFKDDSGDTRVISLNNFAEDDRPITLDPTEIPAEAEWRMANDPQEAANLQIIFGSMQDFYKGAIEQGLDTETAWALALDGTRRLLEFDSGILGKNLTEKRWNDFVGLAKKAKNQITAEKESPLSPLQEVRARELVRKGTPPEEVAKILNIPITEEQTRAALEDLPTRVGIVYDESTRSFRDFSTYQRISDKLLTKEEKTAIKTGDYTKLEDGKLFIPRVRLVPEKEGKIRIPSVQVQYIAQILSKAEFRIPTTKAATKAQVWDSIRNSAQLGALEREHEFLSRMSEPPTGPTEIAPGSKVRLVPQVAVKLFKQGEPKKPRFIPSREWFRDHPRDKESYLNRFNEFIDREYNVDRIENGMYVIRHKGKETKVTADQIIMIKYSESAIETLADKEYKKKLKAETRAEAQRRTVEGENKTAEGRREFQTQQIISDVNQEVSERQSRVSERRDVENRLAEINKEIAEKKIELGQMEDLVVPPQEDIAALRAEIGTLEQEHIDLRGKAPTAPRKGFKKAQYNALVKAIRSLLVERIPVSQLRDNEIVQKHLEAFRDKQGRKLPTRSAQDALILEVASEIYGVDAAVPIEVREEIIKRHLNGESVRQIAHRMRKALRQVTTSLEVTEVRGKLGEVRKVLTAAKEKSLRDELGPTGEVITEKDIQRLREPHTVTFPATEISEEKTVTYPGRKISEAEAAELMGTPKIGRVTGGTRLIENVINRFETGPTKESESTIQYLDLRKKIQVLKTLRDTKARYTANEREEKGLPYVKLFKRDGVYHVSYPEKGKTVTKSLKTSNEEIATGKRNKIDQRFAFQPLLSEENYKTQVTMAVKKIPLSEAQQATLTEKIEEDFDVPSDFEFPNVIPIGWSRGEFHKFAVISENPENEMWYLETPAGLAAPEQELRKRLRKLNGGMWNALGPVMVWKNAYGVEISKIARTSLRPKERSRTPQVVKEFVYEVFDPYNIVEGPPPVFDTLEEAHKVYAKAGRYTGVKARKGTPIIRKRLTQAELQERAKEERLAITSTGVIGMTPDTVIDEVLAEYPDPQKIAKIKALAEEQAKEREAAAKAEEARRREVEVGSRARTYARMYRYVISFPKKAKVGDKHTDPRGVVWTKEGDKKGEIWRIRYVVDQAIHSIDSLEENIDQVVRNIEEEGGRVVPYDERTMFEMVKTDNDNWSPDLSDTISLEESYYSILISSEFTDGVMPQVLYANTTEAGSTYKAVVNLIEEAFGRNIFKTVRVVEKQSDLPIGLNRTDKRVRAVAYNTQVWLVAENLPQRLIAPVLLHEIGVHGLKYVAGDRTYQRLMGTVARLTNTDPTFKAIYERLKKEFPEASEAFLIEETMAYAVENHAIGKDVFWRSVIDTILLGLARLKLWINPKWVGGKDLYIFAKSAMQGYREAAKDPINVYTTNFLDMPMYSHGTTVEQDGLGASKEEQFISDVDAAMQQGQWLPGWVNRENPEATKWWENFLFIRQTKDKEGNIIPDAEIPGKRIRTLGKREFQITPGVNVQKWFINYFINVERLEESIKRQGGVVNAGNMPSLVHGAYKNIVNAQRRKFHREFVRPLRDFLKDKNVDGEDLHKWLYAVHAPHYNRRIGINTGRGPDTGKTDTPPSGLTDAQAEIMKQGLIRKLSDEDLKSLQQAAQLVYAINRHRLEVIRENGLEGEEWFKAILKDKEFASTYVPLRNSADKEAHTFFDEPIGPGKLSIEGPESFRPIGRWDQAGNTWAWSVMQVDHVIDRAEKNKVAMQFARLITDNKDDLKDEMVVIPRKIKGKLMYKEGMFLDENVLGMPAAQQRSPDHHITFKVAGDEVVIVVKDKRIGQAFNRVNMEDSGTFMQIMANLTRWLSAIHTSLNPEFVLTNFIRDIQTALINLQGDLETQSAFRDAEGLSKQVLKDVKNASVGLKRFIVDEQTDTEWSAIAEEFTMEGGRMDFYGFKDARDFERNLNDYIKDGTAAGARRWARFVKDTAGEWNAVVENTMRLSVYKNAKEAFISNGMTEVDAKRKAADVARNLTVNFSQKGEKSQALNSLYLFFNAGVQGTARMFSAVFTRPKEYEYGKGKRLNRVQKIMTSIMIYSFVQGIMNSLLAGDDEDNLDRYKQVDLASRQRQAHIFLPGFDTFVKIPLPYGYNIPYVIGDTLAAMVLGHVGPAEAAMNITASSIESFVPFSWGMSDKVINNVVRAATPSALDIGVDLLANEDYFGRPIYKNPPYGSVDPPSERYWSSTGGTWIATSRFLNAITGGSRVEKGAISVPPDIWEFMWETGTGGMGKFIERTVDLGVSIGPGGTMKHPHGGVKWSKIPFVRRVLTDQELNKRFFVYRQYNEYELSIRTAKGVQTGIAKVYGANSDYYAGFKDSFDYKLSLLDKYRKYVRGKITVLQKERAKWQRTMRYSNDKKESEVERLNDAMQGWRIKLINRVDSLYDAES